MESEYASLASANTILQDDYKSVQELKNSTKETGLARIAALQDELNAWQQAVNESETIEELFVAHQDRLRNLQEKVTRSEKARRVLSDRIQTIKGNVISELIVNEADPSGSFILDVSPDERYVSISGIGYRSAPFGFERVFWGNYELGEIADSLSDALYSALDGKTITLLNLGVEASAVTKRQFLFRDCWVVL